MRNLSAVLVAVVLSACGRGTTMQPVEFSAPAPESTPVTMECVTRELENLGYDTSAIETAPGTVIGIRINERPWYARWLYGNTADQVTGTIDNGQLRVTAVSSHPNEPGEEGPPMTVASEVGTRNARSILETCS